MVRTRFNCLGSIITKLKIDRFVPPTSLMIIYIGNPTFVEFDREDVASILVLPNIVGSDIYMDVSAHNDSPREHMPSGHIPS